MPINNNNLQDHMVQLLELRRKFLDIFVEASNVGVTLSDETITHIAECLITIQQIIKDQKCHSLPQRPQ